MMVIETYDGMTHCPGGHFPKDFHLTLQSIHTRSQEYNFKLCEDHSFQTTPHYTKLVPTMCMTQCGAISEPSG